MAFNLGANRVIVQPTGWGDMMSGFTGPAEILRTSAPFTAGLEASKAREMGLVSEGMADLASNERTRLANDTAVKVAKIRQEGGGTGKRAGLAALLASAPSTGRMAGQVFGVGGDSGEGGGGGGVANATARLRGINDYNDEQRRFRENTMWWQRGSTGQAGAIIESMPGLPRLQS